MASPRPKVHPTHTAGFSRLSKVRLGLSSFKGSKNYEMKVIKFFPIFSGMMKRMVAEEDAMGKKPFKISNRKNITSSVCAKL